jgi:exodeoxyribonuclease VII small subunit
MIDKQTYEQASERIEEIIRRLDSGEAGLRETLDLVKEGRTLIEFCARELEAVAQGLEQLRLDDLVTRLATDGNLTTAGSSSSVDTDAMDSEDVNADTDFLSDSL